MEEAPEQAVKRQVQEIFRKHNLELFTYSDSQGRKKEMVKTIASTSLLQVLAEIGVLCEVPKAELKAK